MQNKTKISPTTCSKNKPSKPQYHWPKPPLITTTSKYQTYKTTIKFLKPNPIPKINHKQSKQIKGFRSKWGQADFGGGEASCLASSKRGWWRQAALASEAKRAAWRVASDVGEGEWHWHQRRCKLLGKWRRQPLASDGGKWSLQTRGDGGSLIGEGGLICEGSVRVREGEEMWFEEEREREHRLERQIYEKREKKLNKKKMSTSVRTIPKMERYCSRISKFIGFRKPHEKGFLVFGVSNAKYLVCQMPNIWYLAHLLVML